MMEEILWAITSALLGATMVFLNATPHPMNRLEWSRFLTGVFFLILAGGHLGEMM